MVDDGRHPSLRSGSSDVWQSYGAIVIPMRTASTTSGNITTQCVGHGQVLPVKYYRSSTTTMSDDWLNWWFLFAKLSHQTIGSPIHQPSLLQRNWSLDGNGWYLYQAGTRIMSLLSISSICRCLLLRLLFAMSRNIPMLLSSLAVYDWVSDHLNNGVDSNTSPRCVDWQ